MFALLKHEGANIDGDSETALNLMLKGPSGYTHQYVPDPNEAEDLEYQAPAVCQICNEEPSEHVFYEPPDPDIEEVKRDRE